jgi:hypothetical protein
MLMFFVILCAHVSFQSVLSSESIPDTAQCSVAVGMVTEVTLFTCLLWMLRGHMALEITIKGGPILATIDSALDRPIVALLPMPAE